MIRNPCVMLVAARWVSKYSVSLIQHHHDARRLLAAGIQVGMIFLRKRFVRGLDDFWRSIARNLQIVIVGLDRHNVRATASQGHTIVIPERVHAPEELK